MLRPYNRIKPFQIILKEGYKTSKLLKRIKKRLDTINKVLLTLKERYSNIIYYAINTNKAEFYYLQLRINQIARKGYKYLVRLLGEFI